MKRLLVITTLLAGMIGCQKASRFGDRPAPPAAPPSSLTTAATTTVEAPKPLLPDLLWIDPPRPLPADVRIEFVHDSDPEEWGKLLAYWVDSPLLKKDQVPASLVGLSPLAVAVSGAVSAAEKVVRIKVPLGLADPGLSVPLSNPMTLGKWRLGQRLFFDDTWLTAKGGESCATCHDPKTGFADRDRAHNGLNTPTLINCVFNRRQFWDGRAELLEEVVQRSLEDEREPANPGPFRHVWHGVIERLRHNDSLANEFLKVFGTKPTQDTMGRAMAVYLRTILAGNSVYDRAQAEQKRKGSPTLEAAHYEAVLRPDDLLELGRDKAKVADVAGELVRGQRLFDDRKRTDCRGCHSGQQFTDGHFYNLGVEEKPGPGLERGRFTTVPIGQKDRTLINAFKTPTLRSLLRTAPYMHNGKVEDLPDLLRPPVEWAPRHTTASEYLDPRMREADGRIRGDDLTPDEVKALVVFLRSLNGEAPAAVLSKSGTNP